jgi:hypothetical protein
VKKAASAPTAKSATPAKAPAAKAEPEVLSLDDDAPPPSPPPPPPAAKAAKKPAPASPPPATKKATPAPPPAPAKPEPAASGDPFAFTASDPAPKGKKNTHDTDEKDEAEKPRSRRQDRDSDEEDEPKSKRKDRDEDKEPRGKRKSRDRDQGGEDEPAASSSAPTAAESAPETAGAADPFGFFSDSPPNDEPKAKKKRSREEDQDEDRPRSKDRKQRSEDDDSDSDEGPRYRRPAERAGGWKPVLLAVVLGLGAVGALVAAVVVMRNNSKEAEQQKLKDAEKDKKKDDTSSPSGTGDPQAEPKKDSEASKKDPPKKDPAESPKKDPPKKDAVDPAKKDLPKKDPVDPPKKDLPKKDPVDQSKKDANTMPMPVGGAFEVPKTAKSVQFRPLAAKPELQKLNPGFMDVPVQFGKVKRVFAPVKRGQDIVVVWVSNPGFSGKGERMAVDVYSGTGARVGQFEYDGDGRGGTCDVSHDAKFFAACGPDNKLTVWNLADKTKLLDGFDPYLDMPEHKKAGIAAVFFTATPGHILTVSTAGAVHLFEIAGKKALGSFVPPGTPVANKVVLGKNVAVDGDHLSIALAVGGSVYQIGTGEGLPTHWKLDYGEVGRPLGVAVLGIKGRITYAFETNVNNKKEKAILFQQGDGAPVIYRWPDAAGEPTGALWAGPELAVIPTDSGGVVYFAGPENKFTPIALGKVTGGPGPHAATELGHWYLTSNAADAAKSKLVDLKSDAINDFRNSLGGKEAATVKLDDKGLWK